MLNTCTKLMIYSICCNTFAWQFDNPFESIKINEIPEALFQLLHITDTGDLSNTFVLLKEL